RSSVARRPVSCRVPQCKSAVTAMDRESISNHRGTGTQRKQQNHYCTDSSSPCLRASVVNSLKPDALHPVIFGIDDVHPAEFIHRDCPRVGELAGLGAGLTPEGLPLAGGTQFLHPAIAALDHVQVPARRERQVERVAELPFAVARLAERPYEF